jgi:hypothetical protein
MKRTKLFVFNASSGGDPVTVTDLTEPDQITSLLVSDGNTSHPGYPAFGGFSGNRARSVLVVLQVAIALLLLIISGLMIRAFQALKQVQFGFELPGQIAAEGAGFSWKTFMRSLSAKHFFAFM